MSAATILAQAYGEGACLYETVLEVPRNATPSQLRKAYYKKALKLHPDKLDAATPAEEREDAKIKFQAISMAYTILSDEEKRSEYDESGDLYDDDDMPSNKAGVDLWTDYFANIFPSVTTADIDAFEVKYKCSDEEEEDVLKYYSQFKGDLNKMLECVMLSADIDKERWVKDYINPAIQSGDVKDFSDQLNKTIGSATTKKSKSKGGRAKAKIEVEDDDEMSGVDDDDDDAPCAEIVTDAEMDIGRNERKRAKVAKTKASTKKKTSTKKAAAPGKNKKSSEDDLFAAIRGKAVVRRQEGFDSMMAGLEERYGGKKKGRGKKADHDDIPDDEFEKIQARIMKNKQRK